MDKGNAPEGAARHVTSHYKGTAPVVPAELYNRLARDGPVEALEAEFKLGSAPVVPSELCYRYIHTYKNFPPQLRHSLVPVDF